MTEYTHAHSPIISVAFHEDSTVCNHRQVLADDADCPGRKFRLGECRCGEGPKRLESMDEILKYLDSHPGRFAERDKDIWAANTRGI